MMDNEHKIKLNEEMSKIILDNLDPLNRQINYQDISTEISYENLDKQLEFYNKTLNEIEILNHNYTLKIKQLQGNINKLQGDINKLNNEKETLNENNKIISDKLKLEKQKNKEADFLKRQYENVLLENKQLKKEINRKNRNFLKRFFK